MSKGIVKRLNSRAAICDVKKKNGEVVEVIVFNQEMFHGVGSHITHPDMFIGNEVELNISKTLTDKYNLYNAELENKISYDNINGKLSTLKNKASSECTTVTAVINRVEKHYIDEMELVNIDNLLYYLNKMSELEEFEDTAVSIALLERFFTVIYEEKSISSHMLSEKFETVIRKGAIMQYLLLADSFIHLYAKTPSGKEYKDDLKIILEQLQSLTNNVLESERRFFATIMDKEYYGVEISFYETTASLKYGDVVLVQVIQSKNDKVRGEVVAVINKYRTMFRSNVSDFEGDSDLDSFNYPCFINSHTYSKLSSKAAYYYTSKYWDGKEYIYMLNAEDETLPNIYWREFYCIQADWFNTNFTKRALQFFAKFAEQRENLLKENISMIFKDKSSSVTIKHNEITYSYVIGNNELIQLTLEDYEVEEFNKETLAASMELIKNMFDIKNAKIK